MLHGIGQTLPQTRLCCGARKPCLACKEGFFGVQGSLVCNGVPACPGSVAVGRVEPVVQRVGIVEYLALGKEAAHFHGCRLHAV